MTPNLTNMTKITTLQALIESSMPAELKKCNGTRKKFAWKLVLSQKRISVPPPPPSSKILQKIGKNSYDIHKPSRVRGNQNLSFSIVKSTKNDDLTKKF